MLILVKTWFGDVEAFSFLLLTIVFSVLWFPVWAVCIHFYMLGHVGESAKLHAEETVNIVDESEETVQEALLHLPDNRCNRIRRIAALAALACRARFGFKRRSEANELVARKWIHDHVQSFKDMRRSDIPMVMPFAIELCFVPSKAELEAKAMMQTSLIRRRIADYEATYWDWGFGYFQRPAPLSA